MQLNRELEQHIAVFGEGGSGKTVLVSSFYGATQEPKFLQSSLFHVVADDIGQGSRLHRNYLGMRDSARRPDGTRFASTAYSFSIKLKDEGANRAGTGAFDALRLVWHDYPGEWFEQDVSGPEEAQRRVDTFRSLLGSDVALLLIDGQRLLDNAGEEERYLRSVLANFRNGLSALKPRILEDGKPLARFPRIWMVALSKADLLPDLDVFGFRDLLIEKATDDLEQLRQVLAGFVESSEAMAVGEDHVLLSSAKFEANRIEVDTRIGLDLVLPIAAVLPFDRHVRWVEQKQIAADVIEELLGGAGALATALIGKMKIGGPKGLVFALVARPVVTAAMDAAAKLAGDQLRHRHEEALARNDYMAAALTGFGIDLEKGEADSVLLRSRR